MQILGMGFCSEGNRVVFFVGTKKLGTGVGFVPPIGFMSFSWVTGVGIRDCIGNLMASPLGWLVGVLVDPAYLAYGAFPLWRSRSDALMDCWLQCCWGSMLGQAWGRTMVFRSAGCRKKKVRNLVSS